MSFGYNANTAFGNTTADIHDHAKDLLGSLIDKREEVNELQRSIIFIAYSLGGIIVKQALTWANVEAQYKNIKEKTIGIVFFGTPHRGSEKAAYGAVLTSVATTVMRKPTSRLLNALQVNSDQLIRLTSEFRFQLPKYQIVSFYERKPMKLFSSPIVEKSSALLEVDGEDQIPVDENHRDICRFGSRDNPVYDKLYRRILRMLKAHGGGPLVVNQPLNEHYYIPRNVSSVFTGRESTCRQLEAACLPRDGHAGPKVQKRFVIYGLGGSGKTQVCLKFAQDHRGGFWGIFWIDASSDQTAKQGFIDIASACGITRENFEAAKIWLANVQKPWLLIIDNADDPSIDVSKYFPAGNRGTVLVTTRNPNCKIHATVGTTELGQMDIDDAVTLLLKSASAGNASDESSRKQAEPVVRTLGCLALAIVQAGAVIRQNLYTLEEYCDAYSKRRKQLLSRQPGQANIDYKYTVYTTWEVSINMIQNMPSETASDAIELLQFFSFLHFDGISEEILQEAWKNKEEYCSEWTESHQLRLLRDAGSQGWDPHRFREAVVLLSSFSLITTDGDNRISMHPLVHTWTRDRLIEEEQNESWMKTVWTLSMSIPWRKESFDYRFGRSLISHIDSCLRFSNEDFFVGNETWLEGWKIVEKFSVAYYAGGRLQETVRLWAMLWDAAKTNLGEEHPENLRVMGNLATGYRDLGRRQEAVGLGEQVLEAMRRILGEEHPDTLTAMGNLAASYKDLGRRQEAVELGGHVLEARRRILGEEHPHTLQTMGNLAISYKDLGRGQEAVELEEQVLEARRRILGEEHPDTLRTMGNLAISYMDLGRRQEALELEEQVLEARRRILGEEHPDTLQTMGNLAISYKDLGRRQEAVELGGQVLEARRRILGEEHPDTLTAMGNLAASYKDLGRGQEAVELEEQVLEAMRRILGEEHPNTLQTMGNLAISYKDLGRRQEAIELGGQVLEAMRRILGGEHPDTLVAMGNLAVSYNDLGRRQEAVELGGHVLEARRRILGEEHPDTLAVMGSLAVSYNNLGRRQEAVELEEQVLEAMRRILGEEHPDTLRVMGNLANSYYAEDRLSEALELQQKAVEASKRILGDEHPDTVVHVKNLEIIAAKRTELAQASAANPKTGSSLSSQPATGSRSKLRNLFRKPRRSLK